VRAQKLLNRTLNKRNFIATTAGFGIMKHKDIFMGKPPSTVSEQSERTVQADEVGIERGGLLTTLKMAAECGADVEFIEIDIPLEECLRKDAMRNNPVGRGIIRHMYNEFQLRNE
jgi:hypothetical protein